MFESGDRIDEWRIVSRLGRNIWRAVRSDGREVAIRAVRRMSRTRMDAWSRLRHPGLVGLWEIRELGPQLCLVFDLVSGPTLREVGPRTPAAVLLASRQIAEAVSHLHARGLAHGDLRLEHARRDAVQRCVLVDPRVQVDPVNSSLPADVCAVGQMLFELYTGLPAHPLRDAGLDAGRSAPAALRTQIRRATGRREERPTIDALLGVLVDLEGSVAVFLTPRASGSVSVAPTHPATVRTAPAVVSVPPRVIPAEVYSAALVAEESPPWLLAVCGLGGLLGIALCTALLWGMAALAQFMGSS